MKTSDIGSSIFFMAMGGFLGWQSVVLSVGSPRHPGPGFFPFCLSLFLIFIAVIIFFQGLKKKPNPPETGLRRSRVAIALGAIILYAFILEPVGYLISTFFLILLLLRIMVKKAWWYAPGVACVVTLVSYLLFRVWLQVLLPSGVLRF
jgi:putative tricarboxylic transport membrane protein